MEPKQNHQVRDMTRSGPSDFESEANDWSHPLFPVNYRSCVDFFKFVFMVMVVIFGRGSSRIRKIRRRKEKHVWSSQIMNELLNRVSMYEYDNNGSNPPPYLEDKSHETAPYSFDEVGDVTLVSLTEEHQPSTILPVTRQQLEVDEDVNLEKGKLETPLLIAAKNGVTEMVEKILELFPVAVHDMDVKKKNIVLLAVENRQTHLYELLLKRKKILKESLFREVDNEGNSALHLAARLGDYKPWLIPGAALQMQWEIKWYLVSACMIQFIPRFSYILHQLLLLSIYYTSFEKKKKKQENLFIYAFNYDENLIYIKFNRHKRQLNLSTVIKYLTVNKHLPTFDEMQFVKESMAPNFFRRYNKEYKTPRDIFSETHEGLVKSGGEWLNKTSESCSVVAAVIATVAFATSRTVPGGVQKSTGIPTLEDRPEFNVFGMSSLIALCCSITSLALFLSILTSRYQEQDFGKDLPRKLILGLTSLFMSITSMLLSFCAGHFFVLKDKLKNAALPLYAVICLPVTLFALAQFPLYFDLIRAIFKKGEWEKVVETYKKEKKAHTARITRTGDTALHVAVIDDQHDVVQQLVTVIKEDDERKEGLRIQNERRNTALHFAASMGSVTMCECIASSEGTLLSMRNVDGETPLFLAALHGRREAFLSLHYLCNSDPKAPTNYSNSRRTDGDTILHSAIAGDYFDLAFQIIHLYEDLVNAVNESGFTPLHLLASKPSVFKSGGRLGRFEAIIYYAIIVKELKVVPNCQQQCPRTGKEINSYPENYQTCMELSRMTKKFTSVVTKPLTQFLHKRLPQKDQNGTERDLEASKKIATNNGDETKSSGSANIKKIRRKKEKHVWSAQIMDELLKRASLYEYDDDGSKPQQKLGYKCKETTDPYSFDEEGNVTLAAITEKQQDFTSKGEAKQQNNGDEKNEKKMLETPILIAAKNGVTEMVEKIMELFPVAVHDIDAKKKNIVLLAVENRQTYLYDFLLKKKNLKESIFRKVDNEGNSALHLAAKLGDYKPWLIPGEALQMHWEIKWYLFVKESMPPHFFRRYNNENKRPRDIFSETHKELARSGGEWLKKTSESCSLVAALIATVAFSTSTTVPGDFKNDTGTPTLEDKPEFRAFAISSLIALCCSVTSLVLFLSILTSRYQERDFGKYLPRKLILGLTSLFMSIASIMVCFCTGHFFVLKDKLRSAAFPVYAVTCLPVTLFALAQFPLYIDLIWATFKKVPKRGYKTSLH
ncbi:Ankyrin repeat-containing protein, partial [Mucuna pruriens]